MKFKNILGILVLSLISIVLVACGGTDEGETGSKEGSGNEARVAIGPIGSESNYISKIMLEAHGVENYKEYEEGFGDAADLVQDGNIDVTMGVLGLPNGSIESLQASTGDVVILGLEDEAIEEIESKSEYKRHTIPAGSYEFIDEDIETVAAYAVLVGNTNTIDDELAYELAKTMVEKSEDITHAQAEDLTLENALNGSEGMPIHPGAKKYYEEQGLTVDNPEAEVTATKSDRKAEYTLGSGSQGGTYYPLGGEIATVWNNNLDTNYTNVETGASLENLGQVNNDELDLGMTVHSTFLGALAGEGDLGGEELENIAFIGHIYPEVAQIVTREGTGYKTLGDLK